MLTFGLLKRFVYLSVLCNFMKTFNYLLVFLWTSFTCYLQQVYKEFLFNEVGWTLNLPSVFHCPLEQRLKT